MMFGRTAPKLCSSPNTSPAQVFLLHRSQFKSRRANLRPTHAAMPCLLCCPPKTLHITTPHTRFCHNMLTCSAISRRALADAGFSDRVFHHRRLSFPADLSPPTPDFPRRILKNCDRSPNKISKIESRGGKKAKETVVTVHVDLSQNISEL